MTDTVTSFATVYLDRYAGRDEVPHRGQTTLTGSHPGYQMYDTGDGQWITVAALEEHFWENLCAAIDTPELEQHHIGPNGELSDELRTRIVETISERISERPRKACLDRFERYDVPAAPVNEYDELFEDPHLESRGMFEGMELPDADETVPHVQLPLGFTHERQVERDPAPRLGSHTASLLADVGYDDEEITRLVEDGAAALEHDC